MKPADLRALRERLGLTQSALAAALGMHVNTGACMERGKKPISERTRAALDMVARLMRHAPPP
jgi:transcriptional regulator with XRE-family HTH domain